MLIAAVAAACPRAAVVLQTGGPVTMPWLDDVPAVLQAWYRGTAGGAAIARVLSGEVYPSGHLPATFPFAEARCHVPCSTVTGIVGAGAIEKIRLRTDPRLLAVFDSASNSWDIAGGVYVLSLAESAAPAAASNTVKVHIAVRRFDAAGR
jgi:hypothetical protein